MSSPESGGFDSLPPEGPPQPEREPTPYLRAARFSDEQPAGNAYAHVQDAIFTSPPNDLSAFRLQLNRVYHVAVLGLQPPAELDERILAILGTGEPANLPDDLVAALAGRRADETRKGPWSEAHYPPGSDEAAEPRMSGRHPFEQYDALHAVQESLERQGYFFYPLEHEHVEGLVTEPVVHRLRTQVKKRGFGKVAGHVALSFSGYADDPREIWQIPEVRAYWQQLDRAYDEFPALLAHLPEFGFNGPSQHLTLVGEIDEVMHRPERFGYDILVKDAQHILADAVKRIRQAGAKYHLPSSTVQHLIDQFQYAATLRL